MIIFHLVTPLLYGKEILEFEEVTGDLLSHETRRKFVNDQAYELVAMFEPKHVRYKFKGKNDISRHSRCKSQSTKDEEFRPNT